MLFAPTPVLTSGPRARERPSVHMDLDVTLERRPAESGELTGRPIANVRLYHQMFGVYMLYKFVLLRRHHWTIEFAFIAHHSRKVFFVDRFHSQYCRREDVKQMRTIINSLRM